jgi:hypothetical protein
MIFRELPRLMDKDRESTAFAHVSERSLDFCSILRRTLGLARAARRRPVV